MGEQDFLSHLLVDIQKNLLLCLVDRMEKRNYLGTRFICMGMYISGLEGTSLHITSQLPAKLLLNIDSAILIYIHSLSENSDCSIVKLPCFPSCVMAISNVQDYSYLSNGDLRGISKISPCVLKFFHQRFNHSFEVLKTFPS